jgi:DMSO/TMAO reductase YedYZ molybdopterin-dependent catalytic subunit
MTDRRTLDRRDFLRLAVAVGPVAALAASGCDQARIIQKRAGWSMRLNDWIGEHVWHSNARLARIYNARERTPERAFPAYFRSRGGVPVLKDATSWALDVGGLVRSPTSLTLEMLRAMPHVQYTVKHHCVEGWTAIGTWSGVPFSAIAALVRPTEDARYVRFDSFDAGYFNGWDLTSAMHPQTILADAFNEHALTPHRGAPLRLYSPVKLGYKMTKYLTRVKFTAERPGGYWEDQGYPWFGGI